MPERRSLRVAVVDDHVIVREGLRSLLQSSPDRYEVVAEAATVAEALPAIEDTAPDLAIVDVVLPDGDGVELCRNIRSSNPQVACLLLTSFPDEHALLSAVIAGAAGYLSKDCDATELLAAVEEAVAGGSLDHAAVDALLDRLHDLEGPTPLPQLSSQESRVFELIGHGLSNREIAEQLFLTEKTVKNYVSRLLSKLDMSRRTEAAALAARLAERRAQTRARTGGAGAVTRDAAATPEPSMPGAEQEPSHHPDD